MLVVEDEPSIRQLLADALDAEGYEVITATNGVHALASLQNTLPDVILLDLAMPLMDGFAFRSRQLEHPHLATVPVIVISAEPHLEVHVQRLSPFAYLSKPFDVDNVLAAVATACVPRI
ncbi:MAG: hypothetical protein NVSMB2_15700 [Chloroflexota bacterium]